jgi:hypothetical protein
VKTQLRSHRLPHKPHKSQALQHCGLSLRRLGIVCSAVCAEEFPLALRTLLARFQHTAGHAGFSLLHRCKLVENLHTSGGP